MTRSAAARAATPEQEEGLATLFGEHVAQSSSQNSLIGITAVDTPKSPRSVAMLNANAINMDALLIPEQQLPFQFLVKRVTDIIMSTALLSFGLPTLLMVATLLKLEDPSAPVFRRRSSVGLGDHVFHKLAFRGPTYRASLPFLHGAIEQFCMNIFCDLLHVFVGDMSFIGPRLVTVKEAEMFLPTQQQRFRVLPGVMGLEQLMTEGEGTLSIKTVARLDADYVTRWSLGLDLTILGGYWSRLMATTIF
jgi:lipopolysaccharide/colanic/teichoic acid biosynthesis glycosyltransferase